MSLPFYRHVFYAGQLYGTYTFEEWKVREPIPDGAYVRYSEAGSWYLLQWGGFVPLNDCDVPKELKALCLLLNLIIA